MTVAEVAELMRVSTMTVYRLIKAGDLPATRVGKSYRITDFTTPTNSSTSPKSDKKEIVS